MTTNVDVIVEGILSGKEASQPQYKVETPGDRIVDDLQRETLFYRQAQSAVIEGLARLKAMSIPTKRPDDYFAQMAKSDDHMLKVFPNFYFKLPIALSLTPTLHCTGETKSLVTTSISGKSPKSQETP